MQQLEQRELTCGYRITRFAISSFPFWNTITISGTPTVLFATFNYSIPLTGGCGAVNATGTKPSKRILASAAMLQHQHCVSVPQITINTTTGATGISTGFQVICQQEFLVLWVSNIITISGTPSLKHSIQVFHNRLCCECNRNNAVTQLTQQELHHQLTLCINTAFNKYYSRYNWSKWTKFESL
jgi:hypothetical protein